WCSRALPAFITVLAVLVLLLILLHIWICKGGRSGKWDNKRQNEIFSLSETTQRQGRKERQTGELHETQTQRLHEGALRVSAINMLSSCPDNC
ncbi:hypothetical protein scyTo_0022456, partial [Scyliorhinus torazame]|nr:hypothetical protein [Scyliorhinus torazame]